MAKKSKRSKITENITLALLAYGAYRLFTAFK
jgi:hypothetical protein